MRSSRLFFLLPAVAAVACTTPVANDTLGDPASRLLTPNGVIEGTIVYQGPRPCSSGGHIVGNAIILAFDARVPPPPAGLANTAVNFVAMPGDAVFPNEPPTSIRSYGRFSSSSSQITFMTLLEVARPQRMRCIVCSSPSCHPNQP